MPKANPKTRNCELCRKPFRSAKRHTVRKKHFDIKKNTINVVLIVCGECKTNLHNWQSKFANSKIIPNRRVTIFGKEFEINGWFGFEKCYRNNKKVLKEKKISFRSFKRYGRKFGLGSADARRKWMQQYAEVIRKTEDPVYRREQEKIWTQKEVKEFNRMLQEDRATRKAEERVIMEQLEQEFSEPFRNWLEK